MTISGFGVDFTFKMAATKLAEVQSYLINKGEKIDAKIGKVKCRDGFFTARHIYFFDKRNSSGNRRCSL